MRNYSSLMVSRALLLILPAVLLLVAGAANAANIYIDDLAEGPPVVWTNSTVQPSPLRIVEIGPEFVKFEFLSSLPAAASAAGTYSVDMLEPSPTPGTHGDLSDRLFLSLQAGSPVIWAWFGSDPNLPPQGNSLLGSVIETGAYQTLATYIDLGNGNVIDVYLARSDAIPTPGAAMGGFVLLAGAVSAKLLRRQPRN